MEFLFIIFSGVVSIMTFDVYQDPEFAPYVEEFVELTNNKLITQKIKYIDMEFVDMKDEMVDGKVEAAPAAVCHSTVYSSTEKIGKKITFNKNYWNTYSERQKTALVFHELGHCILGKLHNDTFIPRSGCPKSLMFPAIIGNKCLQMHWKYYTDELFGELRNTDG